MQCARDPTRIGPVYMDLLPDILDDHATNDDDDGYENPVNTYPEGAYSKPYQYQWLQLKNFINIRDNESPTNTPPLPPITQRASPLFHPRQTPSQPSTSDTAAQSEPWLPQQSPSDLSPLPDGNERIYEEIVESDV